MTKLAQYRVPRRPRYSVLGDPGAVSEALLKRRLKDISKAQAGMRTKVEIEGLGIIVMKKESPQRGRSRTTITVNGKKVDGSKFARAIKRGQFRNEYGPRYAEG